MSLVDLPVSRATPPPPPDRRLRRLFWAVAVLVFAVVATVGLGTYYYSSVPLPREREPLGHVRIQNLPAGVPEAFLAAIEPDFYARSPGLIWPSTLIARRYAVIAMELGDGEVDSWRVRVGGHKLEEWYPKQELLDRYLGTARFDGGAVGLSQAAQSVFKKHPRDLTVAEAALLAVQLGPRPEQRDQEWRRVLDTMVERGWLLPQERAGLTPPRTADGR